MRIMTNITWLVYVADSNFNKSAQMDEVNGKNPIQNVKAKFKLDWYIGSKLSGELCTNRLSGGLVLPWKYQKSDFMVLPSMYIRALRYYHYRTKYRYWCRDIAKFVDIELLLVLRNLEFGHRYWYWHCKIIFCNIGIGIDIAKAQWRVWILVLIL